MKSQEELLSELIKIASTADRDQLEQMIKTSQHNRPAPSSTSILVADSIRLYRNSESPFWWVSVSRLGPRPYRQSTKVYLSDPEKAKSEAISIASLLRYQHSAGLLKDPVKGHGVTLVCNAVIKELEEAKKKRQKGSGKSTLETYINHIAKSFIPYFRGKTIDAVTYGALEAYFHQLPSKSKTQITTQKTAIKYVLDYCLRHGIIAQADYPQLPSTSKFAKQNEKSSESHKVFEDSDLKVILSSFDDFTQGKGDKHTERRAQSKKTRAYRQLFPYYFQFLCSTGVRTGTEPMNLRWAAIYESHFNSDGEDKRAIIAHIGHGKTSAKSGKNKKGREILLNGPTADILEQIWRHKYGENKGIREIIAARSEEYIFHTTEGVPDFCRIMEQYRSYLGSRLKHDYTLYSCRHEYINCSLRANVDIRLIAKQCGNSVAVIEQHYEEYKAIHRAADIYTAADIARFNQFD
ncbi:MAG: site-specific integrase [Gammaproteobacteria bacterium]|nr:site-specific integrase [Gammaproteobacteria bacterium]